jgi:AraC family transcriptional regulator
MQPTLSLGHFYGKVLAHREVGGLVLTETGYKPHARVPKHSHDHPYLCLVRQGGYTEEYGNRTRHCEPMTLAFHPPGEVHGEHFHDVPSRSFNVELAPCWQERVRLHTGLLDQALDFQGGPLAGLAIKLYREFRQEDAAAPLAIEGLLLELLAAATRRQEPTGGRSWPSWLTRAWEVVQDRFGEGLTLSDVARAVDVHPSHLATVFRRAYRCTVGEALRRRRIEYAAHQLGTTLTPLSVLALQAGFTDQSHFCNAFKRQMGVTPSAYRRTLRTA